METSPKKIGLSLAFSAAAGMSLLAFYLQSKSEAEQLWGHWPLLFMLLLWTLGTALWSLRLDASRRQLLLFSGLSGLLFASGFMPLPLVPALAVAWLPLFWVEERLSAEDKPQKWAVFSVAFHAFFLWNILSTYWVLNASLFAGILANSLNAVFMALVFTAYHVVKRRQNNFMGALSLLGFWISFEWGHQQWELSWPWLNLGNAFAHVPWLVQWYEYTGIFGGTLWVLALNLSLWIPLSKILNQPDFSLRRAFLRAALTPEFLLLLLVPPSISAYLYFSHQDQGAKLRVLAIQPNFEPHYQKFRLNEDETFAVFRRLSLAKLDSTIDYLVFPETSFDGIQINKLKENPYLNRLRALLQPFPQTSLVTGIGGYRLYDANTETLPIKGLQKQCGDANHCVYYQVYNSAVQIQTNQDSIPIYHKSKLVPGAENMPYIGNLPFFQGLILDLGGFAGEGLTTQKERSVFKGPKTTVAPLICYESIYGDFVRDYVAQGAELLLVLTNDGWWDETPGHIQHMHLARLRAIEQRRPVLRAANTGISAHINTQGQIVQSLGYNEAGSLLAEVQLNNQPTFYLRYGDLIARIALLIAGLMLFSLLVRSLPGKGDI